MFESSTAKASGKSVASPRRHGEQDKFALRAGEGVPMKAPTELKGQGQHPDLIRASMHEVACVRLESLNEWLETAGLAESF